MQSRQRIFAVIRLCLSVWAVSNDILLQLLRLQGMMVVPSKFRHSVTYILTFLLVAFQRLL